MRQCRNTSQNTIVQEISIIFVSPKNILDVTYFSLLTNIFRFLKLICKTNSFSHRSIKNTLEHKFFKAVHIYLFRYMYLNAIKLICCCCRIHIYFIWYWWTGTLVVQVQWLCSQAQADNLHGDWCRLGWAGLVTGDMEPGPWHNYCRDLDWAQAASAYIAHQHPTIITMQETSEAKPCQRISQYKIYLAEICWKNWMGYIFGIYINHIFQTSDISPELISCANGLWF